MKSKFYFASPAWLLLFCGLLCGFPLLANAAEPFKLSDGDRVLLIGATHIEHTQYSGDVELALTLQHPKKHIVFRNLGWAGDNVFGEARAMFGKNRDGFEHLIKHVQLVKPTVIFVQYGTNESQHGEGGLDAFLKQYNHLLDELTKETKRIVLLSPIAHEQSTSPLPASDVKQVNNRLELYTNAIKQLAKKRPLRFIDLFHAKELTKAEKPITNNGVQINKQGYRQLAIAIATSLGITTDDRTFQNDELRKQILNKNALFFNRSRPQNEVYLRGFRKHEQGNNAKEIYQLDGLIEKLDHTITRTKKTKGM